MAEYTSNYELVSEYNKNLSLLTINRGELLFLDSINRDNPSVQDIKIMVYFNNIADNLKRLSYIIGGYVYFHLPNTNEPFNTLSPYEHIRNNKMKGLLETQFYLQTMVTQKKLKLANAIDLTGSLE